ncbi:MAG TPA: HIT domain-containing protein [Thermoanaerobaculia bacterium]|jgi:diadenosine tetraphosphate (Ap4A) HIT family hydrolase
MNGCGLCGEVSGDVVYRDEVASVVVHPDWSVLGHVMIVARAHVQNPSELEAIEWERFARLWHRVEGVLLQLTGAERAIAMKLGIATPHLHVHLYPVSASATRSDVFAAIDENTRVPRDEEFVAALRAHLTAQSD